jgi:hypothetical protein
MHPDNTVICQVKISRAAMKAAQEAKKQQSTCKRKEKYFSIISKSISCKTVFLIYLAHFLDYFKLLLFRSTNTASPQDLSRYSSFCLPKRLSKGFSLLSGLFYNLYP